MTLREQLVDIGFTQEQAAEAYIISEKDRQSAAEYLITAYSNAQNETDNPALPRYPKVSSLSDVDSCVGEERFQATIALKPDIIPNEEGHNVMPAVCFLPFLISN